MAESVPCPNCDLPLISTDFSWQRGMMSFRSARLVRHCLRCRRRFVAGEEKVLGWLAACLPPELRPAHLRLWRDFEIDWSADSYPRLR